MRLWQIATAAVVAVLVVVGTVGPVPLLSEGVPSLVSTTHSASRSSKKSEPKRRDSTFSTASRRGGPKPASVRMGVVLNSLDNPFWVTILEGVRAEARRLDIQASIRAPAAPNSASPGSTRSRRWR